ncbi:hypothetical protein SuUB23_20500 [Streptococcus uberis]|nr:hypothetical protein TIMEGRIFFIN_53 [Bacillus phage vB_BspH_TimeGriffin]
MSTTVLCNNEDNLKRLSFFFCKKAVHIVTHGVYCEYDTT